MCGTEAFLYVTFALVFGLPAAVRPRATARVSEVLDAVGSERAASAVEPADWNVTVTWMLGVVLTGGAAVGVVVCLA